MATLLERFSATAGFLEDADIEFRPGLNCVIGARGTCKSTLLESIRFAFNVDEPRIEVLRGRREDRQFQPLHRMLETTLGLGGSVQCHIRDGADGTTYSIERDLDSAPRIFRDGVKDHTDTSLLDRLEIYSQGDLQRIAESPDLRLGLIDRPHHSKIQRLREDLRALGRQLQELGPQLRAVVAQVEQLRSAVRTLPELQIQLGHLEANRPRPSDALAAERAQFLRRQTASQAVERALRAHDRATDALQAAGPLVGELRAHLQELGREQLPESATIEAVLTEAVALAEAAVAAGTSLRELPIKDAANEFTRIADELNEPYYRIRQQEEEVNRSMKAEDHLRSQVTHVESQQKELDAYQAQLESLRLKRAALREQVRIARDEIFRIRSAEVDSINRHHGNVVLLTLVPGGMNKEYIARVQSLLAGSRLRAQDEIGGELARALTPAQLVDIVESGDSQELADVLGRDLSQATRLMSFLLDSEDLHSLEGHVSDDQLDIALFDDGQPKPVGSLSKGQKATALLPLILRDAPYPLVFDQPEDDLDNRFIFHSLITALTELKQTRQLIFVTHNANIPVIGEADQVVVMSMTGPERAAKPLHGNVDERQQEIVDLLEGGAAAFRERRRRYGSLVDEEARP